MADYGGDEIEEWEIVPEKNPVPDVPDPLKEPAREREEEPVPVRT